MSRIRQVLLRAGWIRYLTFRRAGNVLLLYVSWFVSLVFRKPVVWGRPFSLTVEPAGACNLRCPECPVGAKRLTRKPGNMSMELFRRLLDETGRDLLWLNLYFQGEPFLNPSLPDMIGYARAEGIHTMVSTNGHYLSGETAKEMVDSGLDILLVGVDGTDQITYEEYRKGGNLEKVLEGIREVVAVKRNKRTNRPRVILQFLVTAKNEHQINEIRTLARELGVDGLEYKSAQLGLTENPVDWLPAGNKYSRYHKKARGIALINKLPNRCRRIWTTAVVTWDGLLVPCCFDKDAAWPMGDAGGQSVTDLWKGPHFHAFRMKILKNRKEIEICRNCTEG